VKGSFKNFFSRHSVNVLLLILAFAVLVFSFFRFLIFPAAGSAEIPGFHTSSLVIECYWEGRDETLNSLVKEYENQHGNIKISLNIMPYKSLLQNMHDNAFPACDIIAADRQDIAELQNLKIIDNETYPVLNFFYLLFYNTDILEKAGFNRPPKTRGEFLSQARAIAGTGAGSQSGTESQSGIYAAALSLDKNDPRGLPDFFSWVWAGGIDKPSLARLKDALEFLAVLKNENLLVPDIFTLDEDAKLRAFLESKAAFMIGSAEEMELVKSGAANTFGYTAIPAPDNYSGRPYFASGDWSLAITAETKHREEALAFISFLKERGSVIAGGWAVPDNGNPGIVQDPFYSKATELYIGGQLVPDDYGTDDDIYDALKNFLNGGISSDEAAKIILGRLE